MRGSVIACLILASGALLVAQEVPKGDLFLGYSFVRYNSSLSVPTYTANGGLGGLSWNFNDHVAGEADLGGYYNHNPGNTDFATTTFDYLFGPRISYGRSKKVDPFFHVLLGGQTAWNSLLTTSPLVINPGAAPPPSGNRYTTSQNAFAVDGGVGLDIRLSRHILFRPVQVDYLRSKFGAINVMVPPATNGSRYLNNIRYAAGIAYVFGVEKPITTKTCWDGSNIPMDQDCPKRNINLSLNTSQTDLCAGPVVKVRPAATLPDGATTEWTVNGEPAGRDATLDFATANRPPGTERIALKVTKDGFNDATAETSVTIRAYQPPSGSVTASPSEVWVGEKSTLSANFSAGQCGGPLQPATFTASEGSISGNEFDSSGILFDPADNSEQRKTITITAKVSDPLGSGSADTQIIVKKKATIVAKRLPDVLFPPNSARVNNCGKRLLLEQLKTYTDADPTGTVYFIGHQSSTEKAPDLAMKRALNAAAVISAGTGVCTAFPSAQVQVKSLGTKQAVDFQPYFCGSSAEVNERRGQSVAQNDDTAKLRRVEVWFVPTNGQPPVDASDSTVAVAAGVASLGCPR